MTKRATTVRATYMSPLQPSPRPGLPQTLLSEPRITLTLAPALHTCLGGRCQGVQVFSR